MSARTTADEIQSLTARALPRGTSEPVAPRDLPAAIIIGGNANALSIARSLGRRGIPVYAINKPGAPVCYSRFARRIKLAHQDDYKSQWTDYLLSEASDELESSVLLAASDVGLEIIAENREALSQKFRLDLSDVDAQQAMLDKLRTYRLAKQAEVPTPKFWEITSADDLERIAPDLVFPLLVKPKSSYQFTDRFKGKFFVAGNLEEVQAGCETLLKAGIEFVLMERIPGPDSQLCSYYTYLDESGEPQFHFTKRIIRRSPPNMGIGCYHVTDWIPEVQELGLKLFQAVGLRGLCNAEFKQDPRDGGLKLIECNARFTEANGLVVRSGFDLGQFVYNRIVGLPNPPLTEYRTGVRWWYPLDDFRSYLALRREGELSFWGWLKSISRRQTLPLFRWSDPLPSLASTSRRVLGGLVSRKKADRNR